MSLVAGASRRPTPTSLSMSRTLSLSVSVLLSLLLFATTQMISSVHAALNITGSGYYRTVVSDTDGVYPYLESPTYLPAADDTVNVVDLPFAFQFFDTSYRTINIGSNGDLQFVTQSTTASPQPLPAGNLDRRPFIAFAFTDLQAIEDDDRSYGTITDSTGLAFLIRFRTVRYFNSLGRITVDVLLRSSTNVIEVVVYRMDASGSQSVLIGLQRSSSDYTAVVNAVPITSSIASDLVGKRIVFTPTGETPVSRSVSTDELGCPLIKTPRTGSVIASIGLSFPTVELYTAYGSQFASQLTSYLATYLEVSNPLVVCASIKDRSSTNPTNSIVQFAVLSSDEIEINARVEEMADDLDDALSALNTDALTAFSRLSGALLDASYVPVLQQVCVDGTLSPIDECSELLSGVSALGRASLAIGITLMSLLFVSFWILYVRSYNNTRTHQQMVQERNERAFEKQNKSKRSNGVFMDLDAIDLTTTTSSRSSTNGSSLSNGRGHSSRTKSLLASDSLMANDDL